MLQYDGKSVAACVQYCHVVNARHMLQAVTPPSTEASNDAGH